MSTLVLAPIATYFVGSSIAIVATVAQFFASTFNPSGSNSWAYWLFYFRPGGRLYFNEGRGRPLSGPTVGRDAGRAAAE